MLRGAAAAALLAASCSRQPAPRSPLEAAPVDTARVNAAEAARWRHTRSVSADLNADGSPDRLVLASDVELSSDGTPLWEDGHRWAVYVDDGAEPTLLYGAFVPNGHVEAAVMNADSMGHRHVYVQERTPGRARSMVVAYESAGRARAISDGNYYLESWLPTLTTP